MQTQTLHPEMALLTRRLLPRDQELARQLFTLMAEVFDEERQLLSAGYIDQLLSQETFWTIAAFWDEEIVGGITAHTLPMTRSESAEIFVYDIAVRSDYQRRGVGRQLIKTLRREAAAISIQDVIIPADNEDQSALSFYDGIGGEASPVTFFIFSGFPD